MKLNLTGSFNALRLGAERIARQGPVDGERGAIVLTASVAAYEGQIGQINYSAAKGGVVAMTIVAARDLASKNIRVCTIAPGVMETPLLSRLRDDVRAGLAASVPNPAPPPRRPPPPDAVRAAPAERSSQRCPPPIGAVAPASPPRPPARGLDYGAGGRPARLAQAYHLGWTGRRGLRCPVTQVDSPSAVPHWAARIALLFGGHGHQRCSPDQRRSGSATDEVASRGEQSEESTLMSRRVRPKRSDSFESEVRRQFGIWAVEWELEGPIEGGVVLPTVSYRAGPLTYTWMFDNEIGVSCWPWR